MCVLGRSRQWHTNGSEEDREEAVQIATFPEKVGRAEYPPMSSAAIATEMPS